MFSNGVIICNGKAASFEEGRQRLRRYARQLQTLGFSVRLRDVKLITVSTSQTLSSGLDLQALAIDRALLYEPELSPALNFKINRVKLLLFSYW